MSVSRFFCAFSYSLSAFLRYDVVASVDHNSDVPLMYFAWSTNFFGPIYKKVRTHRDRDRYRDRLKKTTNVCVFISFLPQTASAPVIAMISNCAAANNRLDVLKEMMRLGLKVQNETTKQRKALFLVDLPLSNLLCVLPQIHSYGSCERNMVTSNDCSSAYL